MSKDLIINNDGSELTDLNSAFEALTHKRYAMPPAVAAALRQAGAVATKRLLDLLGNEKEFAKLSVKDQLAIISLVYDRAYGKSETASASDTTAHRLGENQGGDHAAQLGAIESRMLERSKKARALKSVRSAEQELTDLDNEDDEAPSPSSDGATHTRRQPNSSSGNVAGRAEEGGRGRVLKASAPTGDQSEEDQRDAIYPELRNRRRTLASFGAGDPSNVVDMSKRRA